jgi:hypothetical protein
MIHGDVNNIIMLIDKIPTKCILKSKIMYKCVYSIYFFRTRLKKLKNPNFKIVQ